MKKIIVGIAAVLVIAGTAVFFRANKSSQDTGQDLGLIPTPVGGITPVSYKDGSYTGSVGSASQYGDIQVKVTVIGGKITDIAYLKFPTGGGHTAEVTAMAEPLLKQEAIAAQSAKINIVSGATQDTEGFIQSLQSALDQAKI